MIEQPTEFQRDLGNLLNMYGKDNQCNIPDFILAQHIENYLEQLSKIIPNLVDHDYLPKRRAQ